MLDVTPLLGLPYVASPCGEGPNARFDQRPLYRDDAFDCVTFVNTVLANGDRDSYIHCTHRDALVAYQNRLHFLSVDWNPVLCEQGILTEITQSLCDTLSLQAAAASALVSKKNWYRHKTETGLYLPGCNDEEKQLRLRELQSLGQSMPDENSVMTYCPIDVLCVDAQMQASLYAAMPDRAVLEIVRPNWDAGCGTAMNCSHLGVVIKHKSALMFVHASSEAGCVVAVPVWDYLTRFVGHASIKGIAVFAILMP